MCVYVCSSAAPVQEEKDNLQALVNHALLRGHVLGRVGMPGRRLLLCRFCLSLWQALLRKNLKTGLTIRSSM